MLAAGVNLALDPPAAVTHAAVAYVPLTGWEGRSATPAAGGGWAAATSCSSRTYMAWISPRCRAWDASPTPSRWATSSHPPARRVVRCERRPPVLGGQARQLLSVWAGPARVLLARYSAALRLTAGGAGRGGRDRARLHRGDAGFSGSRGRGAGLAERLRGVELTVGTTLSTAHLTVPAGRRDVRPGRWIIYPGVALSSSCEFLAASLTLQIAQIVCVARSKGAGRCRERALPHRSKNRHPGSGVGNQDLVVEGRIEGRIALENRLTVEESGSVEATWKCRLRPQGGCAATWGPPARRLHPTARVVGNIRAPGGDRRKERASTVRSTWSSSPPGVRAPAPDARG